MKGCIIGIDLASGEDITPCIYCHNTVKGSPREKECICSKCAEMDRQGNEEQIDLARRWKNDRVGERV